MVQGRERASLEPCRRVDDDEAELGREQARAFAAAWTHPVGLVAHSVALRATQTAELIAGELALPTFRIEGIHEVQVGDLEDRNDEAAITGFNTVYQRWHEGELDVPLPGATVRIEETGQSTLTTDQGNYVLERVAPLALNGVGHLSFQPDGVTWTLDAPLDLVRTPAP